MVAPPVEDAGAGQALSAGDAAAAATAAAAAAAAASGQVRVRVGLGGHGAWDNPGQGGGSRSTLRTMSRKKTSKSKVGSVPASSTLPAAANGPRLAHPRTARPGPEAPPNGPPQSGRPSLGSTGDFYDVAFKVSRAPPRHGNAAGGVGS